MVMGTTLPLEPRAAPLTRLEGGGYRVTGTRISLELVVEHYQAGETPEAIVETFDTLRLADVYAIIAYYLDHKDEVEAYMRESEAKAEETRRMIEATQPWRPGLKEELLRRKALKDKAEGTERQSPTARLRQPVSLAAAYLTMWVFAVRYWKRGRRADSLTDFITDIGPVLDGETSDPAQIHDWIAAAQFVLDHPERPWASYGDGEVSDDPRSL
jgi:uncharacterized protein (DUF433 family)